MNEYNVSHLIWALDTLRTVEAAAKRKYDDGVVETGELFVYSRMGKLTLTAFLDRFRSSSMT